MYYLCITDNGGNDSVAADMMITAPVIHHLQQHHLIKAKQQLTRDEIEELMYAIGKTRKSPQLIGMWGPAYSDFPAILEYEKLYLGGEK